MHNTKKIRDLQLALINSQTSILVKSDANDYDEESGLLKVDFSTYELNKEDFVNEIFSILNQVDLGITNGMQMSFITKIKNGNNDEFMADITFFIFDW